MIGNFLGSMGSGKSLSMVRFAYHEGLNGKKIISNIKLNFPKEINVQYMPFSFMIDYIKTYYESSEYLKEKFYNSVIIMDELVNAISSRKASSNLNELLTNFIMMISKLQCHLIYSSQMENQIDIRLRTVTNKMIYCYRIGKNEKNRWVMIDPEKRTVLTDIRIIQLSVLDRGIMGKVILKDIFDPKPYYSMYDTFEMTLMDKTEYLKGGSKDIGKKIKIKENTLFNFKEE